MTEQKRLRAKKRLEMLDLMRTANASLKEQINKAYQTYRLVKTTESRLYLDSWTVDQIFWAFRNIKTHIEKLEKRAKSEHRVVTKFLKDAQKKPDKRRSK